MGTTKSKIVRNFLLILTFLIIHCSLFIAYGTVRYVSTTGSSTPPYTSWETAADSIQECINFSLSGDTIIVANGIYYESLVVDKYLWLIGSSMDSTVIDGAGLADFTVDFQNDGNIRSFTIKGKGAGLTGTRCIWANLTNVYIESCIIGYAGRGIGVVLSSSVVDKCFFSNLDAAYSTYSVGAYNPIIKNSIILLDGSYPSAIVIGDGASTILNNIILGNLNSSKGIGILFGSSVSIIQNNIVSGFDTNIEGFASDTAIVQNNVSTHANERGYIIGVHTDMRNNISAYNQVGVIGPTDTNSDYNLYWQNNINTGVEGFADHDIIEVI
jgi:hypothetical protein